MRPAELPPVSDRIREDEILREHGYAIYSREAGKPVIWRKGNSLYTHDSAMIDVRKAQRKLRGGLNKE